MSNDTTTPMTAEELLALVRSANARLPIVDPIDAPADSRRRLGHVSVPFSAAAANAIGAVDGIASTIGFTDAELRQVSDDTTTWNTVIEELRTLLARTENTNLHRRQRVGLAALQTLHIARMMMRNPASAMRLAPHVAEMERLNTFANRKAKRKQPAPADQPHQT